MLALVLASVWTDVLWYGQLGYTSVYRTELLTKGVLFLLGALITGGAVLASLLVAYRSRPIYAPVSTEQASLDRYRESIEPLRRLVVIAVPVALGLFAGSAASQQWQDFLLWWNRVPFGTQDAQFGLDVGFFVFTLPWLQFLVGFFSVVVFLSAVAALVTHYLYGGLRLQGAGQRMTSVARVHLATLASAFLLLRAVDYWLGRYDLATKDSRLITGLTYTDANITLTARSLLAVLAVIVAALFVVAAVVDRWRMLPLYGVALFVVAAIVAGGIIPAAVQRFQVTPSAATLERPYIERNVAATRTAYGLDAVKVTPYAAKTEASPEALKEDAVTQSSIRLIDPTLVSDAFRQLQQNKQYYAFADSLDVDRYTIDGKTRDTVIAVRELNVGGVEAARRNWYNDHVVYTHGFGVVAAYGNEKQTNGAPVFAQSGIPTTGKLGQYEPRVYFGEGTRNYSIVGGPPGSTPRELDFPADDNASGEIRNTYAGNGGVPLDNPLNKLLYALKFREQNILLSDAVNDQSKIMYDRTPRQRVEKVAPFLTLDGDPYPAVVNGRVTWILDAYTTTSRYPYSRTTVLDESTADSLTAGSTSVVALQAKPVNYIRNSVKATVDAFDGSVTLYAWDEKDPLLQAWQKVFPTMIKPLSQMSGDLIAHVRYPEDLFKVQRSLLATYHVTSGEAFFGGQDFWQVPADPSKGTTNTNLQPPYYLTLQMPGQDKPSFSLTSAFIPRGAQGRNILTGYLAVNSDAGNQDGVRGPNYGQLQLLQLPRDTTTAVPGPGQVQNAFNTNPTVQSILFQLRGGAGGTSTVENGNLLTLPLNGGLLYVQPVYVRSTTGTSFPLLQKVLVGFGDKIGFDDTLDGALKQVFTQPITNTPGGPPGGTPGTTPTPGASPSGSPSPTPSGSPSTPPATGTPQAQLQAALAEASQALTDSQRALQANDFAAYGQAQARLRAAVERAVAAQARLGGGTAPSPSASPTGTG